MYIQERNLGNESKVIRSFSDFCYSKGKNSKNFQFEKKKIVQNGKTEQISILELGCNVPLTPTISHKKLPYSRK